MKDEKEKNSNMVWTSSILPTMVGHTIAIHNENEHIPIYITNPMVGRKLVEFVPTRHFMSYENERFFLSPAAYPWWRHRPPSRRRAATPYAMKSTPECISSARIIAQAVIRSFRMVP
jgi:small subunit ribosomal protein S19